MFVVNKISLNSTYLLAEDFFFQMKAFMFRLKIHYFKYTLTKVRKNRKISIIKLKLSNKNENKFVLFVGFTNNFAL